VTVVIRSSAPADVVWEQHGSVYLGWIVCTAKEVVTEFGWSVDGSNVLTFDNVDPRDRRLLDIVHECSGGGEAGDRARYPLEPPVRSQSVQRVRRTT
jgi:hypothetical protein